MPTQALTATSSGALPPCPSGMNHGGCHSRYRVKPRLRFRSAVAGCLAVMTVGSCCNENGDVLAAAARPSWWEDPLILEALAGDLPFQLELSRQRIEEVHARTQNGKAILWRAIEAAPQKLWEPLSNREAEFFSLSSLVAENVSGYLIAYSESSALLERIPEASRREMMSCRPHTCPVEDVFALLCEVSGRVPRPLSPRELRQAGDALWTTWYSLATVDALMAPYQDALIAVLSERGVPLAAIHPAKLSKVCPEFAALYAEFLDIPRFYVASLTRLVDLPQEG